MKWTEYDPTKVPATRSDIHNFPNKKVTGKKHYDSALTTGNNNAVAIKAYNIAKDAGFTDDQAYEYVYDAVTHANKTLWNPEVKTNYTYKIQQEHIPPYQESYSPTDHGEITKSVDKFATIPLEPFESYEQKIAKGWKNLKNNKPEISLAVDVGSIALWPLGIFDAGMAVDNIKNPNVENSYGDYFDLLGFIPTGKIAKRLAKNARLSIAGKEATTKGYKLSRQYAIDKKIKMLAYFYMVSQNL